MNCLIMRSCLVLCGGGGKSQLFLSAPTKYLDIDSYMWDNTERKKNLQKILDRKDIVSLSKQYEYVMKNDKKLREDKRIILVHHPINATWLNRDIIGIYRPIKSLHEKNIATREKYYQELARNDWNALTKYTPIEFDSYPFL